MATQEFHIDYFDKAYLNVHFPNRENNPCFQLSEGDIGGTLMLCPDEETDSRVYSVISEPDSFPALALDLLQYLKKPVALQNSYQARFSKSASVQIKRTGIQVLEEILALHNDLVTPKRTEPNLSYA